MKIYAIQIPSEDQEDLCFEEDLENGVLGVLYPDIAISGNRDFYERGSEDILNLVHEAEDEYCTRGDGIAAYLTEKTGRPYRYHLLCGCVQREWNYLYYPDDDIWSDEQMDEFNTRYWNLGTEWLVSDDPALLTNPEQSCETLDVYCTHDPVYEPDALRKELCDAYGSGRPEDYVIRRFTGYKKIAQYTEL